MSDLWTMMWKEAKDEFYLGGRAWIRPLIFIGILGIALPLQFGLPWLALPAVLMFMVLYAPFLFVLNIIGDAIAGERERHTLETLLASRVADRAILLGKVIMTVAYAWGMTLLSLLLGFLAINLSLSPIPWAFYSPFPLLLCALVLSLLASLLAASAGVLVSQHSATVRQAQQTLVVATLALGVVSFLALKLVPAQVLVSLSYVQILLIIMAVLIVLDGICLGISLVSFRRTRLILS
jgi:ABC-2 type transport system permease protein